MKNKQSMEDKKWWKCFESSKNLTEQEEDWISASFPDEESFDRFLKDNYGYLLVTSAEKLIFSKCVEKAHKDAQTHSMVYGYKIPKDRKEN